MADSTENTFLNIPDPLLDGALFETWHSTINDIIAALQTSGSIDEKISEILLEALKGNQVSPYLADPSSDGEILYPDPNSTSTDHPGYSSVSVSELFSFDWNEYTRNGTFYIPYSQSADVSATHSPFAGETVNGVMTQWANKADGICWVGSVSENGPVVQIAAMFLRQFDSAEPPARFSVRYGERGSGAVVWHNWLELPNRNYLDTNFLNKTTSQAQSVKANTTFKGNLAVSKALTAGGNATFKALTIFGTIGEAPVTRIVLNPSTSINSDRTSAGRYCAVEVLPTSGTEPSKPKNYPLWDMSNGSYVLPSKRNTYVEPIWIDKEECIANINGTAQYANFIVPQNMISNFKPWDKAWEISDADLWKPASAQALKDLFDWTRRTCMPFDGGVFTGVVRHNQDIFLDHLAGAQENRTAALRSVVRPLNLQCQGSTHVISNSKQACLYLEKEDADSAEFTVEHHDASFVFRKIVINLEKCREADRSFSILNSSTLQKDGRWECHTSKGRLTVWFNGKWEFIAEQAYINALGADDRIKIRLYYRVEDAVCGTAIASNCEYLIEYKPGDNAVKAGFLDITAMYWQVVVTDTDWEGLPIVKPSTLAQGSRLVDGTFIAYGSVVNGVPKPNPGNGESGYVVNGFEIAYGTAYETRSSSAMLSIGSKLLRGSFIAAGSAINGSIYSASETIHDDIVLSAASLLAPGSILKPGSSIRSGSIVNGTSYTVFQTIVEGLEIAYGSASSSGRAYAVVASGSTIAAGSVIATDSVVNGRSYIRPTIAEEDIYLLANAMLSAGSVLKTGSIVKEGSVINGKEYSEESAVEGFEVSYGAASDLESSTALLTAGSKVLKGSIIAAGSTVNGTVYTRPVQTASDLSLASDATLASGTVLKSGSTIMPSSVINGFMYTIPETVAGQSITERTELAPGSKILLGSRISSASRINGSPESSSFLEVLFGRNENEMSAVVEPGSVLLEGTVIALGSTVNGVQYTSPSILSERMHIESRSYLANGTKLASNSVIAADSIINGMQWQRTMKISGIDSINVLSQEDIAPILYYRTYDNIHNKWNGGWIRHSFREMYPNAVGYDSDLWKDEILNQLSILEMDDESRNSIISDLNKSLELESYVNDKASWSRWISEQFHAMSVRIDTLNVSSTAKLAIKPDLTAVKSDLDAIQTGAMQVLNADVSMVYRYGKELWNVWIEGRDEVLGRYADADENVCYHRLDALEALKAKMLMQPEDDGYIAAMTADERNDVAVLMDDIKTFILNLFNSMEELKVWMDIRLDRLLAACTEFGVSSAEASEIESAVQNIREGFDGIIDSASAIGEEAAAEEAQNWISQQLQALNLDTIANLDIDEAKIYRLSSMIDSIVLDLDEMIQKMPPASYDYPKASNLNTLFVLGSYVVDKSSATAPNTVFDSRCYVGSLAKNIGVERISVQPYKVAVDEHGQEVLGPAAHSPVDIFRDGDSIQNSFYGDAFRYFNFSVVPSYTSEYSIHYDTQLVPEQKNVNAEFLQEFLVFRVYSDTINVSGQEVAEYTKKTSINVSEMFGAPFVYGARTRTGITSEGQLGDTLYDLGGMEISEDAIALKIRKRKLNDLSPAAHVRNPVSLVFERKTDGAGMNAWEETISLRPSESGTVNIGRGDMRFANVYLASDAIVSSDRNLKAEIADFPETLLKKWEKVKWVSFKFKDAISAKGQHARIHSGVVAQDVMEALKGVKLAKWSFFCKDNWEEQKNVEWISIPEHVDEFGILRKAKMEKKETVAKEAGEQYSIRYQEMQCIENAYLRREISLLKDEIAKLKKLISKN